MSFSALLLYYTANIAHSNQTIAYIQRKSAEIILKKWAHCCPAIAQQSQCYSWHFVGEEWAGRRRGLGDGDAGGASLHHLHGAAFPAVALLRAGGGAWLGTRPLRGGPHGGRGVFTSINSRDGRKSGFYL